MRATCPDCGTTGHVSAFFADDDGKRLVAAVVDLPAVLQRPVLGYLNLFKPAKNALSSARATRVIGELQQLVNAGSVCRDERGGMRRTATAAMWAEGIEQMLAQRASLTLPLPNHNYLRAVVYTIADNTDAKAERATEQQRQTGQHRATNGARQAPSETKLERDLRLIAHHLSLGQITPEQAKVERAAVRARHSE